MFCHYARTRYAEQLVTFLSEVTSTFRVEHEVHITYEEFDFISQNGQISVYLQILLKRKMSLF